MMDCDAGTASLNRDRSPHNYKVITIDNLVLVRENSELYTSSSKKDRSVPMAFITLENTFPAEASRLYEMMKDHPIAHGELEFPIMGHPYPISVGRINNNPASLI